MSEVTNVFGVDEIRERITEVARLIRADSGSAEVFLLGILKGGAVFLSDLLRAVEGPAAYGFIDVVRDEADTETAAALEIDFVSHTSITGRHVYVLKDVVSTGIIENYLLTQLRMHNPASLKLIALLDRPALRTVELATDHRIFEVGEGTYVGYGLELDGRYSNLPWIGTV